MAGNNNSVSSKLSNSKDKMKDSLKLTFSIIIFTLAVLSIGISKDFTEVEIILFFIFLIGLGGLIISLTFAVWAKQNRKEAFLRSLKLSFGLSSLIFLFGYLFTALQPIFLK